MAESMVAESVEPEPLMLEVSGAEALDVDDAAHASEFGYVRVGEGCVADYSLLQLRVTTWNLLAPLLDSGKLFPCIKRAVHSQEARHPVLQRRLTGLDSDVILMQEAKKAELVALMETLSSIYEYHYVSERCWSQAEPSDAERGAAILWRKGLMTNVTVTDLDIPSGPPCCPLVRGTLVAWGQDVIFTTAHLDGDSPKPALARAQKQLLQVSDVIMRDWSEGAVCIWGGDCNLTPRAPAFAALPSHGFAVASGRPDLPTCFTVFCQSHLDHIFYRGPLDVQDTQIPECPIRNCCFLSGFFHVTQVMVDFLGLSSPKVPGLWRRLIGCLLVLPWLLAVVWFYCMPLHKAIHRCRWVLEEWGSDHLPVTVTFKRPMCGTAV